MRFLLVALLALPLAADEGMWLFNQFPKDRVQKTYGFEVTDAFLDHMRLSSVRLNSGGSGSFVSPHGLLFTNHHVAADCIQKIGSSERDYMRDGFYAKARSAEVKCPDLEVNVLLRMQTVTDEVRKGVPSGAAPAEANRLRQANIARIEKQCVDSSGNRCDVVTLFSGERYDLYEYKKYTDLRLVFAPEFLIAFFGGDPDNFTYPRFNMDISFFRAYENGKPASTPHYLKWSATGAREGELVFVPGNPGSTSRLDTVAQLEFQRDHSNPLYLDRLASRIRLMKAYGAESAENKRVAHDLLFGFENSFKAVTGEQAGLREPQLMERKRAEENKLRAAVANHPSLRGDMGGVWDQVAEAYRKFTPHEKPYTLLENGPMGSTLFRIARWCLRLSVEKAKPNNDRLREYRDSALRSLELRLYSTAPITDSLETVILTRYFEEMRDWLGADHAVVRAVLAGRGPREAAQHYVGSSKLKDVAERKRLAASAEAGRESKDGMIELLRLIDAAARAERKFYEDTVEAVNTTSAAKIARARFVIYGPNEYPDATFTPRVAYGAAKGYTSRDGRPIPWATTFDGLYRKATGKDPYELPPLWLKRKDSLDLKVPLNFVSTADITGGNSGSPTVNTRNEVTGIIFDGNIESLPIVFVYDDLRARAVHVAGQGILEALRKVYQADTLVEELTR